MKLVILEVITKSDDDDDDFTLPHQKYQKDQ
jgi:hypothetical protein